MASATLRIVAKCCTSDGCAAPVFSSTLCAFSVFDSKLVAEFWKTHAVSAAEKKVRDEVADKEKEAKARQLLEDPEEYAEYDGEMTCLKAMQQHDNEERNFCIELIAQWLAPKWLVASKAGAIEVGCIAAVEVVIRSSLLPTSSRTSLIRGSYRAYACLFRYFERWNPCALLSFCVPVTVRFTVCVKRRAHPASSYVINKL